MKQLFIVLLIISIGYSCKKEPIFEPGPVISDTPIFKLSGTIGEDSIKLQAGIDNVVQKAMITNYQGINVFESVLSNDKKKFAISISQGEVGLPFNFQNFNRQSYLFSKSLQTFVWYKSLQPNYPMISSATHVIDNLVSDSDLEIYNATQTEIKTTVQFSNGVQKVVRNNFLLGYKDLGAYRVNFTTTQGSPVLIKIIGNSSPISQVQWYVDNVFFAEGETIQLPSGLGSVVVRSSVKFQNGIVRDHEVVVDTDGMGYYLTDMHQGVVNLPDNLVNDYAVYIDIMLNGVEYFDYSSSEIPGQLTVNSMSFFKDLPNGNKMYKVDGNINGKVIDDQSGILLPLNLNVTFALELPF